jgi:general secretion pathway protein I
MTSRRGFTLLEVLVAVSILGLGLTVILSSQVGLFSSTARSEHITIASGLARCRMNETELKLLQDGYPLIDQTEDGPCCADEDDADYRCSWKIERVELPEGTAIAPDGGAPADSSGLGALGALATAGGGDGDAPALPSLDAGVGGLGDLMGGSGAGMGDLAGMVMGMVYPDLKPMLEASIRKITVTVSWKEGSNDRDLSVTQYVTNPQQGGIDQNAANGMNAVVDQLTGQGSPATPPSGAAGGGS